eukprot:TRINITY_DN3217_c0_g3_i2.p1 TRINITY_DN3217_c0_g3~~TRINITY_DN3217_c0_g3_i2.p1  ORF type:complete len:407 (+),score=138.04 TRINITY_DN3217_c0_g3_i2:482-1702(+)
MLSQINKQEQNAVAPRVMLNRLKAAQAKEDPSKDPDGLMSVFGQLFSQLRNVRYGRFLGKRDQQMWSCDFQGEGSIDVGGPYRECLVNACADLMSTATPLFIRCPNGKNDVGLNREKWIPNPQATSVVRLAMFEFVGVLMGVALTTQAPLPLDLPSVVWKTLLEVPCQTSDLEMYDHLCVQALKEMNKLDADQFESLVDEHFTTRLASGQEVELKEGGRTIPVTAASRQEFSQLVIQRRLMETQPMSRAIKKGLNAVVPPGLLSLFSWHDLQIMVCGNPNIDIEALRRHTVYRGLSASSPLVKYLWQALTSFTQEERQLFLRFVWGRNRLPATDADWGQQFTLHALHTAPPDALPIAHTCFFSLDLPPYPSYEILRSKVLYAIVNCQAIDIDFNVNSSFNAWVDSE